LRGEKTRWIRGRTYLYTVLLAFGMIAMTISLLSVKPLRANLVRMDGPPFFLTETTVRNHFRLRLVSKLNDPKRFHLRLSGGPEGARIAAEGAVQEIAAMGEELFTVPIEVPRASYLGAFDFRVVIEGEDGKELTRAFGGFAGPHPRLMQPQKSIP
jgi:polyferredoxin